jgi:molybdate transport system substrate-binding protein
MARRHIVWGVCLVLFAAACGGDDEGADGCTVFAAASLTDAFEEIAAEVEGCTLSFGGSSALVQQIEDGAPADVLATADERTMAEVADDAEVFAHNRLVLVVPAGNPGEVAGLADFARDDLFLGLCAAEVPCGKLGAEWLAAAGVTPTVDTYEPDVRSLLTKLEAGELDAGLAYATDARAAGDAVEVVDVATPESPPTAYPIVGLTEEGGEFVDYVLGSEGQAILADHGFEP